MGKKDKKKGQNRAQRGTIIKEQADKDFVPNSTQKNRGSKYYSE